MSGPPLSAKPIAFRGTLVHTPAYGQLDFLLDKIVIVSEGKIARIASGSVEQTVLDIYGLKPQDVRRLAVRRVWMRHFPPPSDAPQGHNSIRCAIPTQDGEFLMPGLIDTHVHAPQVRPPQ